MRDGTSGICPDYCSTMSITDCCRRLLAESLLRITVVWMQMMIAIPVRLKKLLTRMMLLNEWR